MLFGKKQDSISQCSITCMRVLYAPHYASRIVLCDRKTNTTALIVLGQVGRWNVICEIYTIIYITIYIIIHIWNELLNYLKIPTQIVRIYHFKENTFYFTNHLITKIIYSTVIDAFYILVKLCYRQGNVHDSWVYYRITVLYKISFPLFVVWSVTVTCWIVYGIDTLLGCL